MTRTFAGSRRLGVAIATAALAVVTAGCSGSAAVGGGDKKSDRPIKFGLTTALTGAYSEFGVPMKNSFDLALKEYNDKGGVLGRKLELVSYDDQLVAETAQSNMRRLLNEDKVDFVLSPAGSGPTLAVLPLVNAQKKIMMNTIAQTSTIVYPNGTDKPPHGNVFSFALGNVVEAQFIGEFLAKKYTKVGLIGESTPYGKTGLDEIANVLTKDGRAKVVARETYDQQATDVTAQLARIRQAGPDVIAMVGLGNDTATVRQSMARLGMMGTPFVVSNGAGTIPYQERAKQLVDGTLVVHYAAFPGNEPVGESAKKFALTYKTAYGNDRYYGTGEWPAPSFGGTPASSYDALKVLLEAIKKAGSVENTKVIQAFESGQAFSASRGDYTFSNQLHTAVTPKMLSMDAYRVDPSGRITFEHAQS